MRCIKNGRLCIINILIFSIFICSFNFNSSIVFANDGQEDTEVIGEEYRELNNYELMNYLADPQPYDLGLGFVGAGLVGKTIAGITVTSGMVIAASGVLFAASFGVTAYSIYNFIKSTRPKEEKDGAVIFHMGLEEFIGESFTTNMDNVNMNKSTSHIDLNPYPVDNYVCLGSFPFNTSVIRTTGGFEQKNYSTYLFADLIYYDDIFQSFKATYPNDSSNLIFTFASGFLKGSTVTQSGMSSLPNFPVNRYFQYTSVPKVSHIVIDYSTRKDAPYFLKGYRSKIAHDNIGKSLRMSFEDSSNFTSILGDAKTSDFTYQIWVKNTEEMKMRGLVGATVYDTIDTAVNDGEIIIPDDKFKINEDIKVIPPAPEIFTQPDYDPGTMPIENTEVPFPDIPPEITIKPTPTPDPKPEPEPEPEPNPDPNTPWEWVIKWMTDFWNKLKQLLIDVLKFVFVPETWVDFVKDLDETLKDKFPFIDQINDLKDTIHFSGNERLVIPFIRGTVITLPDYFENNREVFRQMLSAIMHVLFLIGIIKRFIPKMVITDAGK